MEMEPVVLVSIVVLCLIFVVAMVLLLLLCRHKYYKKLDLLSIQHQQNAPEQTLVENMEGPVEHPSTGVELDQVRIQGQNIEEILRNSEWVEDATGLAPHCLAILKTCHMLSEKLVGMTMQGNTTELSSPETMTDLVATAKRISPRVDDVVKSLYPPLDPRLLEARCTALVLSVSHLVLITKNACRLSGVLDWIDQSLADVDDHLRVLREASVNFDEASPQQQQLLLQQQTTPASSMQTASSLSTQRPEAASSSMFPVSFDERVAYSSVTSSSSESNPNAAAEPEANDRESIPPKVTAATSGSVRIRTNTTQRMRANNNPSNKTVADRVESKKSQSVLRAVSSVQQQQRSSGDGDGEDLNRARHSIKRSDVSTSRESTVETEAVL